MHNAYANEDMGWSGLHNQLAKKQAPSATKPATVYSFRPLIHAAPAHQDTVLTSMLYMKKSLLDLDMQYANLYVDMQLYMYDRPADQVVAPASVQGCRPI